MLFEINCKQYYWNIPPVLHQSQRLLKFLIGFYIFLKFLFNSHLGCFGLSGETEGNAGLGGGGCLMGGGGSVGRGPGVLHGWTHAGKNSVSWWPTIVRPKTAPQRHGNGTQRFLLRMALDRRPTLKTLASTMSLALYLWLCQYDQFLPSNLPPVILTISLTSALIVTLSHRRWTARPLFGLSAFMALISTTAGLNWVWV